eukprot:g17070.t1
MAPAYEDMPWGGAFARPPAVDEWNVPVYHFNPIPKRPAHMSATRGFPGTSGGPLGTLMPLPLGLNTQVVEATHYDLERPDPFAHRGHMGRRGHLGGGLFGDGGDSSGGGYIIPLPWVDASSGRRKPDTTSKQMLGDQGIAYTGISQVNPLGAMANRKIYNPNIF